MAPAKALRDEVLVTRPGAEAGETADLIRARGLVPVMAPLLEVVRMGLHRPARFDAVLVTSGNAVASLDGVVAPVLAVGDATAQRAVAAGFAQVESAGGDADDLVALVRRRWAPGARLLLATGRGQGGGVAAALRAAGFLVHRRVAYHARPVTCWPEAGTTALRGGRMRSALFLSAETASTFQRLLPSALHPSLEGVEALAISQRVADALTPLPWGRVRVSVRPTLDQVLALL